MTVLVLFTHSQPQAWQVDIYLSSHRDNRHRITSPTRSRSLALTAQRLSRAGAHRQPARRALRFAGSRARLALAKRERLGSLKLEPTVPLRTTNLAGPTPRTRQSKHLATAPLPPPHIPSSAQRVRRDISSTLAHPHHTRHSQTCVKLSRSTVCLCLPLGIGPRALTASPASPAWA